MQFVFSRLALLAMATLLCTASVARADEEDHEQAVLEFFQVMKMPDVMERTVKEMVDMQVQVNPTLQPFRETLMGFMRQYMNWETIEPEMVNLYMEEFTQEEIEELTAFYNSPLGRKVTERLPAMTAKGAALGKQRIEAHLPELNQRLQAESARLRAKATSEISETRRDSHHWYSFLKPW